MYDAENVEFKFSRLRRHFKGVPSESALAVGPSFVFGSVYTIPDHLRIGCLFMSDWRCVYTALHESDTLCSSNPVKLCSALVFGTKMVRYNPYRVVSNVNISEVTKCNGKDDGNVELRSVKKNCIFKAWKIDIVIK